MIRKSIQRKEHILLLHSQITKEYDWLYKLLLNNKKIDATVISSLNKKQQSFMENVFSSVLDTAAKEWHLDTTIENPVDLGENPAMYDQCMLCNQPIRFKYFIRNIYTGETIFVGSTCVKDFNLLRDKNITIKELEAGAQETRRLSRANAMFPGMPMYLGSRGWKRKIEESDLVFPDLLEKKYIDIWKIIYNCFQNFESGDLPENEFKMQVNNLLKKAEEIEKEMEQYIENFKDEKFMLTRKLFQHIKRCHKKDLNVKKIKKTGFLTSETLYLADEPKFMKTLLPELNNFMKQYSIKFKFVEEQYYVYEYKKTPGVLYKCSHKQFIKRFGPQIFGKSFVKEKYPQELLFISDYYPEERSVAIILTALESAMEIICFDIKYDGLLLKDKDGYLIAPLNETLKKLKNNDFIDFKGKRYTKRDLLEDKEAGLYPWIVI